MTQEPVVGNDFLIKQLRSALQNREHALKAAPGLLRRTLETGAWKNFHTPHKEHVTHERFADFLTAKPFEGLGITVKFARQIIADDLIARDLLDQALQNPNGGDRRSDDAISVSNIHTDRPAGTTKDSALRRLRKDAPELHAQVLAGDISAHAAMVQAGFRPKTFTVRADRAESVARALKRNLTADQLTELRRLLATTGEDA